MYESAVVAFMCREAGGDAVDETGASILEIQPENQHQRTALYVGSKPLWTKSPRSFKVRISRGILKYHEMMHVLFL